MSAVTIRVSASSREAVEAAIDELTAALVIRITRRSVQPGAGGQWHAFGALTIQTEDDDDPRRELRQAYMARFEELNGGKN